MTRTLARLAGIALLTLACEACSQSRVSDVPDPARVLAEGREINTSKGPREALPVFERALRAARSKGDQHLEAIALGSIGVCYKNLGKYQDALRFHEQALQMKRALGDREQAARTLTNIGQVYWKLADYDRALQSYREALDIFEQLGTLPLQAAVLNGMSLVYDELGDFTRSRAGYERALAIYAQSDQSDSPGAGDTLGNLGGVHLLLGQFDQAEQRYTQSLQLSERLGDVQRRSLDLGNLGLCSLGRGDLAEALGRFDRARALAHDAGLEQEEADWLKGRSEALLLLGRHDEARQAIDTAAHTYERSGLRRELSEALLDLGGLQHELGDLSEADKSFARARAVANQVGFTRGVRAALVGTGDVEASTGQVAAAAVSYAAALQRAREDGDLGSSAEAGTRLALVDVRLGRIDEATSVAAAAKADARATGSQLLQADADLARGEILLRLGQFGQARQAFSSAEAGASATKAVSVVWRAAYGRGRADEGAGEVETALASYRRAVDVIEQVRGQLSERRARAGYLTRKQQVYQALIRLLVRSGRTGEALTYSEQLRAQGFRDLLQQGHLAMSSAGQRAGTQLLGRLRRLQDALDVEGRKPIGVQRQSALANYSEELDAAEREYSANLDRAQPDDGASVAPRFDEITLNRVRDRLPVGTGIIEYVVLEDGVAAFVLTRSGVAGLILPVALPDLTARVELFRDLVARPEDETWVAPASGLHALLIEPLERAGWLAHLTRCYIVPHGVLHYLPFAALRNDKDGTVLAQRYMLALLPSAAALLQPQGTTDSQGVLAMAPNSAVLPYTRDEVEAVGRLAGEPATILIDAEATETAFARIAPTFSVIHLATHAALNRANPLFSTLELAGGDGNDGHLQVFEVFGLRLSSRLVVLSACETALATGVYADEPPGDEFIGLTQAFLSAGSRAVLASLWSINDRMTVEVMRKFYEALRASGPAAALANVQREFATRHIHPHFWAPFVVVGPVL